MVIAGGKLRTESFGSAYLFWANFIKSFPKGDFPKRSS